MVSESIVVNDICPHGTNNLIYKFQVSIYKLLTLQLKI